MVFLTTDTQLKKTRLLEHNGQPTPPHKQQRKNG